MRHALILASIIFALTAVPGRTATQWYDGPWVFSQMQNCVTGVRGTGSGIRVGFQADPKQAARVGQTFYARAIFGMVSGCVQPQHASLELVMPRGAALAVDAAHPVRCQISADGGKTFNPYTPCVTAPKRGTYGQALPPDGQAEWTLPYARIFIVEFPVRVSVPMRGLAGGSCPRDLDELLALPHNNCLLAVFHVADGYRDPWMVAHQNLVVVK
jgi:hypothetical protein